MTLNGDIKNYIQKSVLCWLATVSADGQPNVSPKEIFTFEGENHLLIANIASPQSVNNILENPKVCVSFIEIFIQKGYKIYGNASIIKKNDANFKSRASALLDMAGERFPIHSLIVVDITKIKPIVAPSYLLYPESTSEAAQIESAKAAYLNINLK